MKLKEVLKYLAIECSAKEQQFEQELETCYVSDLLSNVMGQALEGSVWVTMQGHQNVVAIASLLSLPLILVTGNSLIEPETLKKAEENGILVLNTPLTTFEVAGKLYELGLRGASK